MPSIAPPVKTSAQHAIAFVGWLLFCFAAAATGFLTTQGNWYAALNKPSWNPPSWLFGPVWTLLYVMMATSAWLVWRERGGWRTHRLALGVFCLQWLWNALWTPLFFGAHRIDLALIDIALLWCTLATTLMLFWRVRVLAGALLIPYLAWVSFAAVLNFTIWRMNQ